MIIKAFLTMKKLVLLCCSLLVFVACQNEQDKHVVNPQLPKLNEIWYTNGSTTEATNPFRMDMVFNHFHAYILSNTYDAEEEHWVIEFDRSLTKISGSAFNNCTDLVSIYIPDSVSKIGSSVFSGCSGLESFHGKFASKDCRSLIVDNTIVAYAQASGTEYAIPDGVTTIGASTFYGCANLESVTIPDSVTALEEYAFGSCVSLKTVTLPNSITSTNGHSFYDCSGLESIVIPESLTKIGDYEFCGCSSLVSVTMSDAVTSIGDCAFAMNTSLASIELPKSLTKMGRSAFNTCSSLESVTIPDRVTSIGSSAFHNCSSLVSVSCRAYVPPVGGEKMFANNAEGRKIYVPSGTVSLYRAAEHWKDYSSDVESL